MKCDLEISAVTYLYLSILQT